METVLVDSAHGWTDTSTYVLEQHWVVDDEDVVRITIQYVAHAGRKLLSSAELVLLTGMTDEAANNPETVLRLRAFPWQWWQQIGLNDYPGEKAPELLENVAKDLIARYVAMCGAVQEAPFGV